MADAFDIDELRSTDTDELVIVHPATGAPTTWVWTLAGPGHPATVAASDRVAQRALELDRQRSQALNNRRNWHEPKRTPTEQRRENAETFASRVVGWTAARINGADYPFSTQNVVKLLLDPAYDRVYGQLLAYFVADEAFTQRSASDLPSLRSTSSDLTDATATDTPIEHV